MGEMVSFASNGGTATGYRSDPDGGNGKGVIVLQEWWGLNDHIKDVADRYAAEGFVALAPDMYHGTVTAEPDEAGKLLMALDVAQAEKDLRGAVDYLNDASGGPVGTVGYCMGGALSLFTACTNADNVGACVVYYGGHPAITYDWDNLTAPVLAFWAENDDFANAGVAGYEAALKERHHAFEFRTYPGTHHAFFNNEHPDTFDAEAAADTMKRAIAFFGENL